jgi:penicillin-binding protein 1A
VAGAWVGFNDPHLTMGDSWGPGARSALPMVGDFFVQALRTHAIDGRAEFDIPRPRPKPREPAPGESVPQIINDLFGRLMKMIQ